MNQPNVIIVGAGFGGLQAAKGLKRAPVRVTLLDRSNHHLFQPLLYQVATAGLSPGEIAVPIRSVLRNQKNTEVLMTEVTGVDPQNQIVHCEDRTLRYDYLVLATGCRYSYFGHPEWEAFAPSLKSIPDALYIRKNILLAFEAAEMESDPAEREKFLTFILVGGGPTGVELAGAMAELAHKALSKDFRHIRPQSAKVILIEAGPRILSSFPPRLSEKAQRSLERLGVEVRTSQPVEDIDATGVRAGGEHIASSNVLWTAGVEATPLRQWLPGVESDRSGRIKVKEDLSVPPFSNLFVVGDAACFLDEQGKALPGVAPVAVQQGRYVARHIFCQVKQWPLPRAFKYKDKGNLATVGRGFAIADFGTLKLSGRSAWYLWILVHIFYLIGFKNRLLVLIQWAWSYITFQRGTRLITPAPDPRTELPKPPA